jgi:hypothetical protein
MRHDLPAAAASRPDWPIRLDHCFGRVILDAVCGAPWREVVAAPAWRRLTPEQLARAVRLADAILADEADLTALNLASLALRRRAASRLRRQPPCRKLQR